MPERFPHSSDFKPHGSGHSGKKSGRTTSSAHNGPPRRHSSPEPVPALGSLGDLLANFKKKDRFANAQSDSRTNHGYSRSSGNHYQSSSQNMDRRHERPYQNNGGHKHSRIGFPGEDRHSSRPRRPIPPYDISPIRTSSSSHRRSSPSRSKSRKRSRSSSPFEELNRVDRNSHPATVEASSPSSDSSEIVILDEKLSSTPGISREPKRNRVVNLSDKAPEVDSPATSFQMEENVATMSPASQNPRNKDAMEPAIFRKPEKDAADKPSPEMNQNRVTRIATIPADQSNMGGSISEGAVQKPGFLPGEDAPADNIAEFRMKSLKRSHPDSSDSEPDLYPSRPSSPESDTTFHNEEDKHNKKIQQRDELERMMMNARNDWDKKKSQRKLVERELKLLAIKLYDKEKPMKKRRGKLEKKKKAQETEHLEKLMKLCHQVSLFPENPGEMNRFLKENNYSMLLQQMKTNVESMEVEEKELNTAEDEAEVLRKLVKDKRTEKEQMDKNVDSLYKAYKKHQKNCKEIQKELEKPNSGKKRSKPKKAKVLSAGKDEEQEANKEKRLTRKQNREDFLKNSEKRALETGEQTSEGNKKKDVGKPKTTEERIINFVRGKDVDEAIEQSKSDKIRRLETESLDKEKTGEAMAPETVDNSPHPPLPPVPAILDGATPDQTPAETIKKVEAPGEEWSGEQMAVEKNAFVPDVAVEDGPQLPLPPVLPAAGEAANVQEAEEPIRRAEAHGEESSGEQSIGKKHTGAPEPALEEDILPPLPSVLPATEEAANVQYSEEPIRRVEASGEESSGEQMVAEKDALAPGPTLEKDILPPLPPVFPATNEAAPIQMHEKVGNPESGPLEKEKSVEDSPQVLPAANEVALVQRAFPPENPKSRILVKEKTGEEPVSEKDTMIPEAVQSNNPLLPSDPADTDVKEKRTEASESGSQEKEKTGEELGVSKKAPVLTPLSNSPPPQFPPVLPVASEKELVQKTPSVGKPESDIPGKEKSSEVVTSRLLDSEPGQRESEKIGSSESEKQEKEQAESFGKKEAAFPDQAVDEIPLLPQPMVPAATNPAAPVRTTEEAAFKDVMPNVSDISLPPPPSEENFVSATGIFGLRGGPSHPARPDIGAKKVLLPTPPRPKNLESVVKRLSEKAKSGETAIQKEPSAANEEEEESMAAFRLQAEEMFKNLGLVSAAASVGQNLDADHSLSTAFNGPSTSGPAPAPRPKPRGRKKGPAAPSGRVLRSAKK